MTSVSSLSSIRKTLADFSPPNKAGNSFKGTLSVTINADSQLANNERILTLRGGLAIKILFCKNKRSEFNTPFRVLRDFLGRKGFQFI